MSNTLPPVPARSVPSLGGKCDGENAYATHVATRLREFYFGSSPWQRRLWNASTIGGLREALDAARWRHLGVLSESSVTWLCHELQVAVGRDAGMPGGQIKRDINGELATGIAFDTRHWRRLEQLVRLAFDGYFTRWASSVGSESPPGAERVARAIASHLLDLGYSMEFLHARIAGQIVDGATLGDLFDDAASLAASPPANYEVLLPFTAMPKPQVVATQRNWMSAQDVKVWLAARGGYPSGRSLPRYVGALSYTLEGLDSYGVAGRAAAIKDRLLARASYVPKLGAVRAADEAWLVLGKGAVQAFSLRSRHRGMYVRSLVRENRLYDVGVEAAALDDALELASVVNHSSSLGPAVAAGWSALEALLASAADPEDSKQGRGVVVSRRAAALVACSWPRAELTALSYAHTQEASEGGRLRAESSLDGARGSGASSVGLHLDAELEAASSNRGRCSLVVDALARGERLILTKPESVAAQERMLGLQAAPRQVLGEIGNQVEQAFRRLYRMRNIVMHGGAASDGGLEGTLRAAAPLLGAVMDRISHAILVNDTSPLALAARAEVGLNLVGQPDGPSVVDLLE